MSVTQRKFQHISLVGTLVTHTNKFKCFFVTFRHSYYHIVESTNGIIRALLCFLFHHSDGLLSADHLPLVLRYLGLFPEKVHL